MYSFLIADDCGIARLDLIGAVRASFTECTIEEAENGEALLELLKITNFDILMTDVGKPKPTITS